MIDPFSLVEWRHLNCHDQRPTKNPLLRSFPVSDPHQCDHETPRGSYDSNFTPGMTLNIPVRIIPSIKAMSLNFNALDREKKKKEKKREKKSGWILDSMWTRFKTLHDECTKRRAQVFELAPYEQRESRFRACSFARRACVSEEALYHFLTSRAQHRKEDKI